MSAPTTTRRRCRSRTSWPSSRAACRGWRSRAASRRAPGAAPALALRGGRREGRARRARAPTSPTAATAATRPPPLLGRAAARPPAAAAPAAALARALPRAASARRVAHLLGGRGDAERLLRLVEITDAERAPRWSARRRGRGGAPSASRARPGPRPTSPAAAPRAGALPRHPHVPARRDPDLQRQDVDGRRARAAGAVPRRRADALRRAHPRQAAACARAAASASTGMAMARLLPPQIANRPKHGFATPYDDWLRASLGQEVERRYAAGSALAELVDPAPRPGWWTSTGAAVPTIRRSSTACWSCPSGTPPSSRRGSPWRREAGALRPQPQGELRGDRPRDPRGALRGRGPLPAGPLAEPGEGDPRGAARRPRIRLVRLLAHLLPDHARLAAAQAVGDDRRRLRHGQHARHRLRLPAGRPAALRRAAGSCGAPAGWSRTPSTAAARSSATRRSPRPGDRDPPRGAGPVRRASARAKEPTR